MTLRLRWLRWVVASVAAVACAVAVAAFEAALTVRLMIEGRKQQPASKPRAGDRPGLVLGVCTGDGSPASFEAAVRAVWTGEAAAADLEVSAEVTYLSDLDNLTCSEVEGTDRSTTLLVDTGQEER